MHIPSSSIQKKKHKKLKDKGVRLRKKPTEIVIDREAGLVFKNEKDLLAHFRPQITILEKEFDGFQAGRELYDQKVENIDHELDLTLDEPSEIWHDDVRFKEFPIFYFIRMLEGGEVFHVAIAYVSSEDEPTFIFLHFMTTHMDLVEKYRRGDLVYDRAFEQVGFAAIEGDALTEADPFAMGLFLAMLKLRGEKDVPFDQFRELGIKHREETIERADEIWKDTDGRDHLLVTFIKEISDSDIKDLHYVAITQEDEQMGVHSLLFSFPTTDLSLIDRYRHGENMQADEVVQESSH